MSLVAKSDQGTENQHFSSYVMQSHDIVMAFTAPYSTKTDKRLSKPPMPFDGEFAFEFMKSHGLAVRAIGLKVRDADEAYKISVSKGAVSVLPPTRLVDVESGKFLVIAEVALYGDVVLRYVSGDFEGAYLPGYTPVTDSPQVCYGLTRLDHAVGNLSLIHISEPTRP